MNLGFPTEGSGSVLFPVLTVIGALAIGYVVYDTLARALGKGRAKRKQQA